MFFSGRRRHTRFSRDWSADVCSSDLTPPHTEVLLARGPFTVPDETELLRHHRIDVLVTKNSGGTATTAKLTAARALALPVVIIEIGRASCRERRGKRERGCPRKEKSS